MMISIIARPLHFRFGDHCKLISIHIEFITRNIGQIVGNSQAALREFLRYTWRVVVLQPIE
jgi:hypothetical protein